MKPKDIAEKLDADKRQISRWASQFCNGGGIKGLIPKVGGRYRENMTFDEETELLKQFEEKAIVNVIYISTRRRRVEIYT